jgi:hypothetical protein
MPLLAETKSGALLLQVHSTAVPVPLTERPLEQVCRFVITFALDH